MTVQLEHDPFLGTVADLRRAADRLRLERDRADRQVTLLLDGGWSGRAARWYAEGWLDWRTGCDDVVRGLEAMADLLTAVHRDLDRRDDLSAARLDAVSQRILARLS